MKIATTKAVSLATKVIGPKQYANLVKMGQAKFCFNNQETSNWELWEELGLSERQAWNIEGKLQDLDDDKWLVVSVVKKPTMALLAA